MTDAPLSDEDALQKVGEEWFECVNAIIKRTAEMGEPWSQERAGALIAILAQAGYFFIKIDDMSDDGITPKRCAATIAAERKKIAELERDLRLAKSARDYANDMRGKAEAQLAEVHARLGVVVEALEPMARAGRLMDLIRRHDDDVIYTPVIDANFCITAGDLRKATTAISDLPASALAYTPRLKAAEAERRTPGTVEVCRLCNCQDFTHGHCRYSTDASRKYPSGCPCPIRSAAKDG